MWSRTRLTELLGIELPFIQAPMGGGITTPELVAAVSGAGGLGSIGAGYMSPDAIREVVVQVQGRTDKPFGINLFIAQEATARPESIEFAQNVLQPFRNELGLERPPTPGGFAEPFEAQVKVVLDVKPALFSFTFGALEQSVVRDMKSAGIKVMGTATTVAEAHAMAELKVDLICAQGVEAGGHRGTFLGAFEEALIGNMALVPQVIDAVDLPVVVAGGIMDGRGIAAALALGADGVQLGTAFLRCPESGTHPAYKEALADIREKPALLTNAFSGRPARALANRFLREMASHADELPPYPIQNTLTKDIRDAAARRNRSEFMSLWSGQAAGLARALPAGDLVAVLARETEAVFDRLTSNGPPSAG
jgi:nitronate monooxygenase